MFDLRPDTVETSIVRSLFIAPLIGLAVIAATIILPTLGVVAVNIFIIEDSDDLPAIALVIAEPLALAGAVVVTLLFARQRKRFLPGMGWPLLVGTASSIGVITAAFWVGDVDLWTFAAVVILPTVAFWLDNGYLLPKCLAKDIA